MNRSAYVVYILKNEEGRLYIGQTRDLAARLKRHQVDAAQFVKGDTTFKVVYTEDHDTLLSAMRQKQLKGWRRAKKDALIADDLELLKQL